MPLAPELQSDCHMHHHFPAYTSPPPRTPIEVYITTVVSADIAKSNTQRLSLFYSFRFLLSIPANHTTHSMTERAHKLAFLTIGATASFPALVEAVTTPQFLRALEEQEYTELLVQYGQDGKPLFDKCQKLATQSGSGVKVNGFGIDKLGLGRYMRRAKGGQKEREGVVISHAGVWFC